jgi:hypothetical protein
MNKCCEYRRDKERETCNLESKMFPQGRKGISLRHHTGGAHRSSKHCILTRCVSLGPAGRETTPVSVICQKCWFWRNRPCVCALDIRMTLFAWREALISVQLLENFHAFYGSLPYSKLVCTLNHMNQVHSPIFYLFNNQSVIILLCTSASPQWSLPFTFRVLKFCLQHIEYFPLIAIFSMALPAHSASYSVPYSFFTDGRTPWTSDQPVAKPLPKHRTTQTQNKRIHTPNIHVFGGILTHDPSVQASEDSSCLRPRGHCDRPLVTITSSNYVNSTAGKSFVRWDVTSTNWSCNNELWHPFHHKTISAKSEMSNTSSRQIWGWELGCWICIISF